MGKVSLESASGYLGQPATGTDRQGCEKLLKATEGLCFVAGGGHFEHST